MKIRMLIFIFAVFLTTACSEEADKECANHSEPNKCLQCETCQECQQCPTCKEGDECPACPAQSCPTCKEGDECPACNCKECDECKECPECNTDDLNSQLTSCNNELTTTKQALKTEQEANESCVGDLDSCNAELKTAKNKTLSKNGSRLKVYAYYGVDGSQVITPQWFDTKFNNKCNYIDLEQYSCNIGAYCIPFSYTYLSDSITNNSYYYLCSSTYDSEQYDPTILSIFGSGNMSSKSVYTSIYKHDNNSYYLDSNCTSMISNDYVVDSECNYKQDTILRDSVSYSEPSDARLCIDNSSYTGTISKSKYVYYKPLNPSFVTLYRKSGNTCSVYKEKVILLQQIEEVNPSIEEARANRILYCKKFCQDIDAEAIQKDWVKMELKTIDYE